MEKSEAIQKSFIFNPVECVHIKLNFFTSENIKYTLYFINIFQYFTTLYIIKCELSFLKMFFTEPGLFHSLKPLQHITEKLPVNMYFYYRTTHVAQKTSQKHLHVKITSSLRLTHSGKGYSLGWYQNDYFGIIFQNISP